LETTRPLGPRDVARRRVVEPPIIRVGRRVEHRRGGRRWGSRRLARFRDLGSRRSGLRLRTLVLWYRREPLERRGRPSVARSATEGIRRFEAIKAL